MSDREIKLVKNVVASILDQVGILGKYIFKTNFIVKLWPIMRIKNIIRLNTKLITYIIIKYVLKLSGCSIKIS